MNSTECGLCMLKEETYQHLFIECKIGQLVWNRCLNWLGIKFVQHKVPKIHFVSFHSTRASCEQNLAWKGIWAAIVRCIWDQRNVVLFNQKVEDADEIFQMAKLKVWAWLKHRSNSFEFSYSDWILNSSICLSSLK